MTESDHEYRRLRDSIAEGLKWLEEYALPRIPKRLRPSVEEQLNVLKELLENRPPQFAIVGRRGSGKSSLINAIFGSEVAQVGATRSTTREATWYSYSNARGEIRILDTRGLGDTPGGTSAKRSQSAEEGLKTAVQRQCPDALLFLCKAKEVDARLDEDLEGLVRIREYMNGKAAFKPPVFGIVTQVDELDPPDVCQPPFDDDSKQANISASVKILQGRMTDRLDEVVEVIPVSAYMRFKNGAVATDRRWNIDILIEELVERIPQSARMTLARIAQMRSAQERFARKIVNTAATLAGAIAASPIPVADLPFITGVQTLMVLGIASVAKGSADQQTVVEFLAASGLNVGAAFVFREIARGLIKLIPLGGETISAAVAGAATKTLGEAAIAYFIKSGGKPGPGPRA
jgi:predicted GTPase